MILGDQIIPGRDEKVKKRKKKRDRSPPQETKWEVKPFHQEYDRNVIENQIIDMWGVKCVGERRSYTGCTDSKDRLDQESPSSFYL